MISTVKTVKATTIKTLKKLSASLPARSRSSLPVEFASACNIQACRQKPQVIPEKGTKGQYGGQRQEAPVLTESPAPHPR